MAERPPRGPSTFRKRDVKAAIRAARDAGCEVVRVEIDRDGKIAVITSREALQAEAERDEWDKAFS